MIEEKGDELIYNFGVGDTHKKCPQNTKGVPGAVYVLKQRIKKQSPTILPRLDLYS